MTENVDFELMERLIKDNNAQIKGLRNEQREGFATLKAHDYAQHRDIQQMENRIAALEAQVDHLSTAQGLETGNDDSRE